MWFFLKVILFIPLEFKNFLLEQNEEYLDYNENEEKKLLK